MATRVYTRKDPAQKARKEKTLARATTPRKTASRKPKAEPTIEEPMPVPVDSTIIPDPVRIATDIPGEPPFPELVADDPLDVRYAEMVRRELVWQEWSLNQTFGENCDEDARQTKAILVASFPRLMEFDTYARELVVFPMDEIAFLLSGRNSFMYGIGGTQLGGYLLTTADDWSENLDIVRFMFVDGPRLAASGEVARKIVRSWVSNIAKAIRAFAPQVRTKVLTYIRMVINQLVTSIRYVYPVTYSSLHTYVMLRDALKKNPITEALENVKYGADVLGLDRAVVYVIMDLVQAYTDRRLEFALDMRTLEEAIKSVELQGTIQGCLYKAHSEFIVLKSIEQNLIALIYKALDENNRRHLRNGSQCLVHYQATIAALGGSRKRGGVSDVINSLNFSNSFWDLWSEAVGANRFNPSGDDGAGVALSGEVPFLLKSRDGQKACGTDESQRPQACAETLRDGTQVCSIGTEG